MFQSLKALWKKENHPSQDYDRLSRELAEDPEGIDAEV